MATLSEEGSKIWKEIHELAARAKTDRLKEEFDIMIRRKQEDFKCLECREHFGAYLRDKPPHRYRNFETKEGLGDGYFYWSWEFHESVNKRIGKKSFPYEKAYEHYHGPCYMNNISKALHLLKEYEDGKLKGRKL